MQLPCPAWCFVITAHLGGPFLKNSLTDQKTRCNLRKTETFPEATMTTIVDIAKKLNISKSTVSRALTDSEEVSPKTRMLVKKAAQEMQYQANMYARTLVSQRSHMVSFMIPDITDNFYQKMAEGAESELNAAGYTLFYRNVHRNGIEALKFLEHAEEFHMEGVFITLDDWSEEICKKIQTMDIPVISLRRKTPPCLAGRVPFVDSDYEEGIDNAVSYLLSMGHRNIGYIGFETMVGKERIMAFEASCEKHHLVKNIIRNRSFQDANVRIDVGYTSAKKLIGMNHGLTVIFCGDDQLALGALKYCSEAGIPVPEKMSVMGCDDRDVSGLYCIQLTTMRQQIEESGHLAGQLMVQMIEKPGVYDDICVPMTIKERKTVGHIG